MLKSFSLVTLCLLAASAAAQTPPLPPAPELGLSDGASLIGLARSSMVEYLCNRTPVDKAFIPERMTALSQKPYAVRLTLRKNGVAAATSIQKGKDLGHNVIAAALEVMRGPEPLPDKVTHEELDSATLDLEVMSLAVDANDAAIDSILSPGLTGVEVTRGADESFVWPSQQFLGGLTPSRIHNVAFAQLPIRPQSVKMPLRWSVFSAVQFVGFPQDKVVWLYRGKALMPADAIDPNMIQTAASRVADFLIRNQDAHGQFTAPLAQPSLREHVYATYAMARLAKATGRDDYAKAVNAGLGYAMGFLKDDLGGAFLFTEEPQDQLAATALMMMAIGELQSNEQIETLRAKLAISMNKAARDGRIAARLDGATSQPASRMSLSLAEMAMARFVDANIAAPTSIKTEAESGLTACWMIRSGLAESRNWSNLPASWPQRAAAAGPLDEAGAFVASGEPPSTAVTALCAVNLAAGKTWPGVSKDLSPQAREEFILGAQRLCHQMMYKSLETYFADKPNEWIGGVRSGPQTGRISLEACAAAIEAFIAK